MDTRPPFDSPENPLLIARYGELGLKSRAVQKRFMRQLVNNLEERFLHAECDCYIDTVRGRLYIYPGDYYTGLSLVSTTFGIVSFSPAVRLDSSDRDTLCRKAVEYSRWLLEPGDSFAVRTSRSGSHPYTSQDVNVIAGEAILKDDEKKELSVNLRSPDRTLYIEIRDNKTHFFHEKIKGPGGLPYGASGRSVCALGNTDSLLAAYLMMKRGNHLHFHYIPGIYPNPIPVEDVRAFLSNFLPLPMIHESGAISMETLLPVLDELADNCDASGIILGFRLDRVRNLTEPGYHRSTTHPFFYPVIGLGEGDIREWVDSLDIPFTVPAKDGASG